MVSSGTFQIKDFESLKIKLTNWLRSFDVSCILDSHTKVYPAHKLAYQQFNLIIAAGVNEEIKPEPDTTLKMLDKFIENKHWKFGFLSYDLKNSIEKLESKNIDFLHWPDFYFFSPEILIFVGEANIEIQIYSAKYAHPKLIWEEILTSDDTLRPNTQNPKIFARLKKPEYIDNVEKLRNHILRGDIYEVNYCQEFFTKTSIDPYSYYLKLIDISPTPFSVFFRLKDKYLLSASPERFLKKTGEKLISQPIKGTAKRGSTPEEDVAIISSLKNTVKEQAENVMIVDLVRNDLSRIARKSSVKVEELCGIYSFKQVHQMISTVTAKTSMKSFSNIVKATFPMGSMTGAPKINAMRLAEKYETTKRGLYSGAVGYITPEQDFDFNVVIRSLQYNAENQYLSFMVGGAITYLSKAENEYDECLVKASAIMQLLNSI